MAEWLVSLIFFLSLALIVSGNFIARFLLVLSLFISIHFYLHFTEMYNPDKVNPPVKLETPIE